MMLSRACLAILLGLSLLQTSQGSETPISAEWVTNADLIQSLQNPKTSSHAFHQLWNQAHPDDPLDYETFENTHYDPEIIICPQPNGAPPLSVVLYGFLDREQFSWKPQYEIANPSELFFPDQSSVASRAWDMPAIAVFTSDGLLIEPFGGDNCLNPPGRIADLNGDGLVERADHSNCGISGVDTATVFEMVSIAPKPQPLLSVLYNWGEDEWLYQFTDTASNGIFNIEFGPKIPGGIIPRISYAWNPDTQTYEGPDGDEDDHFRRLDTSRGLFHVLHRLKQSNLTFPPDPDFMDERRLDEIPWESRGVEKPKQEDLSRPYSYASLKDLSNDELLRFMGRGKDVSELEQATVQSNQIPHDFWNLPPKEAALAFAETNRYPIHRDLYILAVDDRDHSQPPTAGSVALTHIHDKSYFDIDTHFFLHVNSNHSYLAYSRVQDGTARFSSMRSSGPVYDFRLCDMDYETARHLMQVLWWLNRIRSHRDNPPEWSGSMWSSADGNAGFDFRNTDGSIVFQHDTTLWSGYLAERWKEDYTPETFVNFASHLFYAAVPEHLGTTWSEQAPKCKRHVCHPGGSADSTPEPAALPPLVPVFLDLFTPDQTSLSLAIVRDAVQAAGESAAPGLQASLSSILSQLPAPPSKRTREEIEAEQARLDDRNPDDPGWAERRALKHRLHEELMASYADTGANDFLSLQDALRLSLRQIQSVNDPDILQAWARTEEPGANWALRQLNIRHTDRYENTLEWWVKNSTNYIKRNAYFLLEKANPDRALELADQIAGKPNEDHMDTSCTYFAHAENMPDGPQRMDALIRVILSTNMDWSVREKAIALLVPPEQPLQYPDTEIDQALLRLMEPDMSSDIINFTLGKACLALARRGRTESFDAMENTLVSLEDLHVYEYVLQALVQLAQIDPSRFNPRLIHILRPQLHHTNKSMIQLLMAAWAADLRELKPDIERIATSGPADYQSKRASSYGGKESDVDERFHLARKIAALWNEEDPATETRLLIAFGYNQGPVFSAHTRPELTFRIQAELTRLARILTPEQHRQVNAFIKQLRDSCTDPTRTDPNPKILFLDQAARMLNPKNN